MWDEPRTDVGWGDVHLLRAAEFCLSLRGYAKCRANGEAFGPELEWRSRIPTVRRPSQFEFMIDSQWIQHSLSVYS